MGVTDFYAKLIHGTMYKPSSEINYRLLHLDSKFNDLLFQFRCSQKKVSKALRLNSLYDIRETLDLLLRPQLQDVFIADQPYVFTAKQYDPGKLRVFILLKQDKWHWKHELYYEAKKVLMSHLSLAAQLELDLNCAYINPNTNKIETWKSVLS